MLHIKKLNLDEIREIYNAYMHEAFPPSELRPFASMEMLYNKNCYPCYGVDFNILVLPIAQPVPEAKVVLHELENIYHVMFDDELYKRVCHPFIAE